MLLSWLPLACAPEGSLSREEPADGGAQPVLPRMALGVHLVPGLEAGSTAFYTVSGAQAGELVHLYGSFAGEGSGPCPSRFGGICLDLAPKAELLGEGLADTRGQVELAVELSPAMAPGSSLSVQALVRRGLTGASSVASPLETALVYGPWTSGLRTRPANPTCLATAEGPVRPSLVAKQRAFPSLVFDQPIEMVQPPGDGTQWWLAERSGRIWRFDDDDAVAVQELVVDLTSLVDSISGELGLLGFAFHPDFELNGEVYVDYTSWDGTRRYDEVVRFTSPDGLTLDLGTATSILRIEDYGANHNGGKLLFGPDGYLYVSTGDGGGQGDPYGNGQNTWTLLGSILRLDVDSAFPYAIPPDNPFADGVGGAQEIYAWGFRNPWRFSFDRATGDLWVGDVGQDTWEEVNRVERGGNYGWDWREGLACWTAGCETVPGLIEPVLAYDPGGGSAVIGGYVYRGAAMAELQGTYVFADYYGYKLRKIDYDDNGVAVEGTLLPFSGLVPSAFAEDLEGELYMLHYPTGQVHRFVPAAAPPVDTFPRWLSETGCVDVRDPTRPVDAMIPFAPNSPLWSDGADKHRWLAIPDGTAITAGPDGDLSLPVG